MIRSLNVQRIWCPYDYGRPLSSNAVPLCPNLRRRRLHICCIASLSTNTVASSTTLTSSIGSPPSSRPSLSQWNLTQRHILVLNFIACTAAISTTWLFCAAIPTLLAFKRAAESLEKVLDVTREELPDTMAAVRLSGMEMSDLTMELSDLGQGITEGVKRSTRAVGLAEERLRGLSNMNPSGSARMQVVVGTKSEAMVGRGARGIRENIVKGRAFVEMFFTLTHFSKVAFKYFTRSKIASKRDR